ncbi:site-specific integrase [Pantoea piersonii]|jgi:integrase|uniref:site-specific integrase n=1 Tax=Pantoea piersonii TaxID=2364647 RepID=UPI000EA399B0|nr:tyrosine-type recombinase/integrase [Pantoea piersonii]MBZ6387482.1 phage integrase Arm DNA-binding domain-containing protein [Pantoea piersonii]MBZ6400750.1 phage integrase Arm DNA-binding domain-containing protein [Pantoea piersonii]MBZ6408906.1 phage integrase Arm DNA-binding domain-containing protein [Pantoea piersonii]MBZ6427089.1 phage integrase Arm DNA-binding domain-containing protein [Pantoea piersonii]NYB04356.1 phage integrase Arm DNA-binding domain-containing protein [Pantoea pi
MAKRPANYESNLPRNLTYRQARKTYHWRNPHTGKEYSLGRIARRDAIAQAIEANNYLDQNYAPSALLMKLQARPVMTFTGWISNYEAILVRRNVKPATMRLRLYQLKSLAKHFGEQPLADITTRDVALFLESYITGGKRTMAVILRSVLNDIFREAIVAGIIERNPVEPTRASVPKIQRSRLSTEDLRKLLEATREVEPWFYKAMLIALLSAQRREDITRMKFSDVRDGRLFITQSKKGNKLAIPVALGLPEIDMTLSDGIALCRRDNPSEYLIYSATRRHGRKPGPVSPENITQAFSRARARCGLDTIENPPTFHEIRSLSGRLYEARHGEAFAQRLLGHKNLSMTKKYLDPRRDEYVLV